LLYTVTDRNIAFSGTLSYVTCWALGTYYMCSCKSSSLPVYRKYQKGQSRYNFIIIPSKINLRRDIVTLPSVLPLHPCEHSRINIFQWILTKLGTYLVLKRIWNPIIFKVKVTGSIFRRGDAPRFALPLFNSKYKRRPLH
jgi:hypothetical protein